jgi:hypothetical protein
MYVIDSGDFDHIYRVGARLRITGDHPLLGETGVVVDWCRTFPVGTITVRLDGLPWTTELVVGPRGNQFEMLEVE